MIQRILFFPPNIYYTSCFDSYLCVDKIMKSWCECRMFCKFDVPSCKETLPMFSRISWPSPHLLRLQLTLSVLSIKHSVFNKRNVSDWDVVSDFLHLKRDDDVNELLLFIFMYEWLSLVYSVYFQCSKHFSLSYHGYMKLSDSGVNLKLFHAWRKCASVQGHNRTKLPCFRQAPAYMCNFLLNSF